MLLLYSEHLQNAFSSDVFPLQLPSMPRVREDLRHTSACDRGKHFKRANGILEDFTGRADITT